jgi:hypothetical protein
MYRHSMPNPKQDSDDEMLFETVQACTSVLETASRILRHFLAPKRLLVMSNRCCDLWLYDDENIPHFVLIISHSTNAFFAHRLRCVF